LETPNRWNLEICLGLTKHKTPCLKKKGRWKNANLQIEMFGVNAQPYYVLIDHKGNKLVPPRAFDLDVDEYVDFLDKGLQEFNNR